ncbi:PREDICTED: putative ribonuclease H protein At1g65750-like [Fragaria vesca subsp. vesca]
MKKEGGNNELGLKLDMNKAYDRVEWDFLKAALIRFGFAQSWVNLIMACVSSVSFSIVLNGCPGKSFFPGRGLRQGDPLSPYLFLIISEVLSVRLTRAVQDKSLLGIKLCRRGPTLSHMFFADDALFFLKATLGNVCRLMEIFKEYCKASGQLINGEKSSAYFSPNTPDQMSRLLGELMGFAEVEDPGKYLGLPTLWGRSKKEAVGYIVDRVQRKLVGWKQRSLSWAGKEILIKSVATAIPAYPMACFKFPKGVCDTINSALSNFWWGSTSTGNRIHWKSWELLGKTKEEGGLGFRDLHQFNMSLLAKQCWRLVEEPNSLWASVLKARYFPNCGFLEATKGYRASWSWASLIEARDLVFQGCCWQVVNGKSIQIWHDSWIPPPSMGGGILIDGALPPSSPQLVDSLIDWDTHTWRLDGVANVLSREAEDRIRCIPIGEEDGNDRLLWPWSKNGSFTVKSGYHWLHQQSSMNASPLVITGTSHRVGKKMWRLLWGMPTLPKVKLFFWQVMGGVGPNFSNLYKRKLTSSPMCPLCGLEDETFEHLLLLCSWVSPIWFGSPMGLRIDKQQITMVDSWFINSYSSIVGTKQKEFFLTMSSMICWMIWKARCNYLYKGIPVSPQSTLHLAINLAMEFMEAKATQLQTTDSLIRDHSGALVGGASMRIRCSSPKIAEAEAILLGASTAASNRWRKVVLESDSQAIIEECRNRKNKNWKIYPIISRIRKLCSRFADCIWSWAPREANGAAHCAAALASRTVGLKRWAHQPPRSMISVLRNDSLPCPPVPGDQTE